MDQPAGGRAQLERRLELNGCVTQALMNKYGWAHPQVAEKSPVESILAQDISAELRLQHLWTTLTFHHVASNRADVMQLAQKPCCSMARRATTAMRFGVGALVAGLVQYSEGRVLMTPSANCPPPSTRMTMRRTPATPRFGLTSLWSAARALVR